MAASLAPAGLAREELPTRRGWAQEWLQTEGPRVAPGEGSERENWTGTRAEAWPLHFWLFRLNTFKTKENGCV